MLMFVRNIKKDLFSIKHLFYELHVNTAKQFMGTISVALVNFHACKILKTFRK